jgi:hypothetical protein
LIGRFSAHGSKIVDGVYSYNFELDSPNVIGVVKNIRLRYAGYMMRGGKGLPQRVLFMAMPQGK